jgi:hypothetical protein
MDSAIAMPLGPDDPQEIGQFKIIGLLGAGGMGEVYLGTTEGGYVAVKRIRPRLVSAERFKREIGILYRVPVGVAPGVLAHDSTVAQPWFAADYVPGLTVDEAIQLYGPLPPGTLWLLLAETAAQLQAVHEAGVVHRDLKPANVMLVRDGVKLIDFGIARAADQARLTRSGGSYGTFGFTAPEQKAGDSDVASPADVYSLGALLLCAASGRAPGPDTEPVRRVDADLAVVVESCLATDPGERPTAAELVRSARYRVLAADLSWPPDVMERIETRREFAATPVGKIETIPPPGSEPEPGPTESEPVPPAARLEQVPWRQPPLPGKPWLHLAAEKLAGDVRKQWEQEERLRQVHDPYPLPVRFKVAAAGLFDHWANIRRTGRVTDPGPLVLDGELDKITAVYQSIPSERLVVLGQAGSGKTILALRFVLDWLSDYTPGDRIPVIFSLGSWDPTAISLRDWMCRRLARDHNALEDTAADGGNLAGALVDNHRILPVLDGFDEIAPGLQGAALAALNYYAGPLLLTSRPGEYARAVRKQDVLTAAACIELQSLDIKDFGEYLTRASRPEADPACGTVWEPVLSKLREQPDTGAANVAGAFTIPLMVALARTVYSDTPGHDPRELLDTERFSTAEAVREHLLAQFVPAAYHQRPAATTSSVTGSHRPRHWNHERAQHWLGYLAWHMEEQGQRDLAWWELGTVMKPRSLMLVVGAMVGLASGLIAGLVYGSAAALATGPENGLRTAAVDAVMNGLGVGMTFGLIHGFATNLKAGGPAFEPSYMRIQLRGGTVKKLRESFLPRVGGGFVGGLLFGVLWAIGGALYSVAFSGSSGSAIAPQSAQDVALGTALGVATGFVAAIGAGFEAVSEKENAARPSDLLNKNRANVLIQLVAVGLVIGVGYGFVLGPAPGLAAGLMVGLGLGTMTAWGRWVVLSRVWLPLTGQVPWAMVAFLEDAHQRGVLRQAGSVYQFRHARIQSQLAGRPGHLRHTDRHEAVGA